MLDPRQRRTRGLSRARLQLELKRGAAPLVVVIAGMAVAVLIVAYIGVQTNRAIFDSKNKVRFAVSDATGVVAGLDDVRISGLPVGEITEIKRADGGQVVLTAEIRKEDGPVYRNARAELRPVTPLQDMYLDIVDRGSPEAGELEGDRPLPADQTTVPVNVADVLNVFRPATRAHLASLLNNFGNGLEDRGVQLRAAFVAAAPVIQNAGKLTHALATRANLTKRLVHNTSELTTELSRRNVELRTLVRDGNTTMGALANRSKALDDTLRLLPTAMDDIDRSFTSVSAVLPDVNVAVDRLQPVADAVPEALASIRTLANTATPALTDLRGPVNKLTPLARTLPPLASALDTTITALKPQTPTYNRAIADAKKCMKGIAGFFLWNTSIGKFSDSRGPTLRGNLAIGMAATGNVHGPNDFAPISCVGGTMIGGRVPTEKDYR